VLESVKISSQAFEQASKNLTEMGISVKMNGDMTAEAAKGYAAQLETIAITSGQASVHSVNALMD
jgi:membrane protease subunit (stomatin/prohibitin family)